MAVSSFLSGRTWQLVEIVSMNDRVEVPDDRLLYTVDFRTDGSALLEQMRRDMGRSMIRQWKLIQVGDERYEIPEAVIFGG